MTVAALTLLTALALLATCGAGWGVWIGARSFIEAGQDPPKPVPRRSINVAPSEEQRLEEVKRAYLDDLIDVEKMEEDIQFVLEGGYFAGSYRMHIGAVKPPLPPPSRR